MSIVFTTDQEIQKLNKQYLNRDRPTNVISFPMEEGLSETTISPMLGDIVVSVDTAKREAKTSGEPFDRAIDRLLVHGLLHLLGFDHEASEEDAVKMEKEEARLLKLMEEK